jgi:hypothetical protein
MQVTPHLVFSQLLLPWDKDLGVIFERYAFQFGDHWRLGERFSG